jgi:hypothetical protein
MAILDPTADPFALPPPDLAPLADFTWPPPEWASVPPPVPTMDAVPLPAGAQPVDIGAPVDPVQSWPPAMPTAPEQEEIQFELGPENDLSPIPEIDAITGVGEVPNIGQEEIAFEPDDVSEDVALFDRLTPEEQIDRMSGEQLAALAHADPATFAQYQLKKQMAAESRKAEAEAKVALADETRAQANLSAMQYARKKATEQTVALDLEAKELAEMEPDAGRFWSSRSVPQTIAAAISIFAGGLAAPSMGGRNIGLEMITNAIDQDVALQRATIGQRRDANTARRRSMDDLYARHGDEYRAAEAVRIAGYGSAMRAVQQEAMKYDPRGTTAMRSAELYQALAAKQGEAIEAFQAQQMKRAKDEMDFALSVATLEGKQLENRKKAGGLGGVALKPEDVPMPKEHWERLGLDAPLPWMSEKQVRSALGLKSTQSQIDRQAREAEEAGAKRVIAGFDGKPLVNADGSPFQADGTPEAMTDIRKRMAATRTVVRALDDLLNLRSGWTSDTVKSKEWQEVKQSYTTALGIAKDVLGLGALSGPDMNLIENFLGGAEPTGVRDPMPGIMRARENIQNITRDTLAAYGYDKADAVSIPNLSRIAKAEESAEDIAHKRAMRRVSPGGRMAADAGIAPVDSEVRDHVSNLAGQLAGPGRDMALAKLEQIAAEGNAATADLARKAIAEDLAKSLRVGQQDEPTRATARDTVRGKAGD